jgi:hypothetical protein
MQVSDKTLLRANYGAALLHTILLAALIFYYFSTDPKKTTVSLLEEAESFDNVDSCKCWPFQGYRTTESKVDIFWMTVSFTIITILAHVFYSVNASNVYIKTVDSGKNPFRWVEYAGSASTMLCILALLAGVRDRNMFVVMFVITFVQMLQGYVIENAVVNKGSVIDKLIPLISGWALCVSWYVIYNRWYGGLTFLIDNNDACNETTQSDSESSPDAVGEDREKTGKPPGFIIHLINVVFVLFSSFGIINLIYLIHSFFGDAVGSYRKYELAYISLSFVAKATLIIWCMSSVFGGELIWLQNPGNADGVGCVPFVIDDD